MAEEPPADDMHDDMHDDIADDMDALGRAEAEELEAEAALADARATAARARAERLRRQAEAGITPTGTPFESSDSGEATVADSDARPRRVRTPRWRPAALGAAVLVLCALLALSGAMALHHRSADKQRQRDAEYAAVARQGVMNLMSLDFTDAKADVQRVLDTATGKFKEDFESQAKFLTEALEKSKVVTEVTVNAVAVESASDDSAKVLVAAKSQATNAKDQRQQPQQFRVAVQLAKDNGQLKISQVDFV